MERPVRIAVVGPVDDHLVGELRQLPLRPEVRPFRGLVLDSEALAKFAPDLVVVGLPKDPGEEIGALRLLQKLWPSLAAVLVGSPAEEMTHAELATRLGVPSLVYPSSPGQLAATIEQARHGGQRPSADIFVDLARGVADEINNPLLFLAGHLQLLRASFDAAQERDRRDQVNAALQGVHRIQTSIDRLRLLSQAANGPRRRETIELGELLGEALLPARRGAHGGRAVIEIAPGSHPVLGDREQLATALAALVQFADDLVAAGSTCALQLRAAANARTLRLEAAGPLLASWLPPHSFEPFYPGRALRGQSPGLGLFLAQTVVLGHRGQATVRRTPAGGLWFDFVLPAATASA
jgi:signal transduction histidine kinase